MNPYKTILADVKAEHMRVSNRLREIETCMSYLLDSDPERFKNMKTVSAVEIVLKKHGKPMHIKEMVEKLQKQGYREDIEPKKLVVHLYQTVNRRTVDIFEKTGREFGLKEWTKKGVENE